ncbi:MAG: sigma-70 family RNA polymerase sigma factor [Terriglobia bacterium]
MDQDRIAATDNQVTEWDEFQDEARFVEHYLVPKEEEEPEEVQTAESEKDSLQLVRYDPLRHYLLEISRYEPLSLEEEQTLARLFRDQHDKEAGRRLVTANLKLVVRIAFLYNKVYANLMDLIQEGNIGLLHAVKKFDPDRGARLPTYASWWIKAYIIKFLLDNFRIVRVGTTNDRRKVLLNLRKEKQRLEAQGITADTHRLAEVLNVSEEDVIAVEKSIQGHDLSLDQKISEDSTTSILETIASTEQLIDEKLASGELKELIESKFKDFANTLSEKERMILQKRLIAEEPLTLQAIADRFEVTREAIRVTEKKLIEKIKRYMKEAFKDLKELRFTFSES